jgi:hypothetical protein
MSKTGIYIPDSVMKNGVPNRKGISPPAEKPSTFQRKDFCHGVSDFESQGQHCPQA